MLIAMVGDNASLDVCPENFVRARLDELTSGIKHIELVIRDGLSSTSLDKVILEWYHKVALKRFHRPDDDSPKYARFHNCRQPNKKEGHLVLIDEMVHLSSALIVFWNCKDPLTAAFIVAARQSNLKVRVVQYHQEYPKWKKAERKAGRI